VAQWKAELLARRPKAAKLVTNDRLRGYVRERLCGQVRRLDGTPVAGPPPAQWKGRNKPRRQDRRWARAWSPQQISRRLTVDFPDDESLLKNFDQVVGVEGCRRATRRCRARRRAMMMTIAHWTIAAWCAGRRS
jgi:hypothetical protein